MEATFFESSRGEAAGVASLDDLPGEPVGESLRFESLAWLRRLAELVGLPASDFGEPLRDATCQSFPVWELGDRMCERVARLSDQSLDVAAERWVDAAVADADAHELCELLCALRQALAEGASLYVLIEEKAL